MRKDSALPTKYITGTVVGDHKMKLTVARVVMETMENGREQKPVMYFVGKDRGMVINSGNWDAMALVYGDESDGWAGKMIELFAMPTQTPAGQPTLGCRIRALVGQEPQVPINPSVTTGNGQPVGPGTEAAHAAKEALKPASDLSSDLDDEIPF